jgi:hypothetical protein
MKLEPTISHMMIRYPTLFGIRQRALEHLYIVCGNGYEWYRGELIGESHELTWDADGPISARYPENAESELRHIEMVADAKRPLSYLYPFYEGCHLNCVPKNVKPDFLAGAKEMLGIILSMNPDEGYGTYLQRKQDQLWKGVSPELRKEISDDLFQMLIETATDPEAEKRRLAQPRPIYPLNSEWQKEARRMLDELNRRFP